MHEDLSIRVFARVADNTVVTCASRAIKEYARVAREFLQYWYLSSHVVRTSNKTVQNNKYWKNPSVINTAIENGDFVVVVAS